MFAVNLQHKLFSLILALKSHFHPKRKYFDIKPEEVRHEEALWKEKKDSFQKMLNKSHILIKPLIGIKDKFLI